MLRHSPRPGYFAQVWAERIPWERGCFNTLAQTLADGMVEKYIKTDKRFVLFIDESRASLDGPDGWAKGWVVCGDNCPNRMRRQQDCVGRNHLKFFHQPL